VAAETQIVSIPRASQRQSAVRLLAVIVAGVEKVRDESWGAEIVGVLRSESRLQALDFWMRNPDYLANELLREFEQTADQRFLATVSEILESREPDIRRFPMVRYLFGAFEPLDDALALLRAYDLVRVVREGIPGQRIREHLYLLTTKGQLAAEALSSMADELKWYATRAALVVQVAGEAGGRALKDRQYLQARYAETEIGKVITPITDRVREKLERLRGDVR